jgi:hypothetical protein
MPISHSKHAVFIHIPKAAGTTIERCMGMQNDESLYSTYKNEKYKVCPQHLYATEVLELFPFTNQYYWFTIVRHPLDRLVSEYHYIKNTKCVASKFASLNFSDFVNCLDMPVSDRMLLFDRHLEPQVNFIRDAVNIEVFKFEQIDDCFNELQNRFHIPFFSHERKSNRKGYKSYYDDLTEKKVKNFYKEDFEVFGY